MSCEKDQLKNWTIYQERDGNYTFKIIFQVSSGSHIESSVCRWNAPANVISTEEFQTVDKGQSTWQEKRLTRSQTAKQNLEVKSSTEGRPAINPESPIESMCHSLPFILNVDNPECVPNPSAIDEAVRTEHSISLCSSPLSDAECDAIDDPSPYTGNCHAACMFGQLEN